MSSAKMLATQRNNSSNGLIDNSPSGLLLAIVFLTVCFIRPLAAGSVEDQIKAADQAWAAAVKAKDVAALDKLFEPRLFYTHATGILEDKTKYLARLRSGKQQYDSVQIEKTTVVPYGDTAVSHSIVRSIGTNDNGPFNDHVMMLHVWIREAGQWRLAAHQTTLLKQ